MNRLPREYQIYFKITKKMERGAVRRILEDLERKYFIVEKYTDHRFPSMLSAIFVYDGFRESLEGWSEALGGNAPVLINPEYSYRTILATRTGKWDYTLVIMRDLIMIKQEKFDSTLSRCKQHLQRKRWERRGRRPKYTFDERAVIGFFGVFFPYSVRETYFLFQLPTVRGIFGVGAPPSYGEVEYMIRDTERRAGRCISEE